MPFYALATIPLLQHLPVGMEQVWYTDDICACGTLSALLERWNRLCELGPSFGYFLNAAKTWLVTKSHVQQDALLSFSGLGIKITSEGCPYLGAPIGSNSYVSAFVAETVKTWSEEVVELSRFAESQPHAILQSLHAWFV